MAVRLTAVEDTADPFLRFKREYTVLVIEKNAGLASSPPLIYLFNFFQDRIEQIYKIWDSNAYLEKGDVWINA